LKKQLISSIKEVISDIEGNSHFNPNLTYYDVKPPVWMEATNYFVSYAHSDHISEPIVNTMRFVVGHTINFWVDSYDLKRHMQIPKALSDAITNSEAALLLLSKNYLRSKWCNVEWQALFMKRLSTPNYRLYIIRLDNAKYPALLDTFNYTDCRSYPKPYALIELGKLMNEIEEYERALDFYKHSQRNPPNT
jgi:hypothetical protein